MRKSLQHLVIATGFAALAIPSAWATAPAQATTTAIFYSIDCASNGKSAAAAASSAALAAQEDAEFWLFVLDAFAEDAGAALPADYGYVVTADVAPAAQGWTATATAWIGPGEVLGAVHTTGDHDVLQAAVQGLAPELWVEMGAFAALQEGDVPFDYFVDTLDLDGDGIPDPIPPRDDTDPHWGPYHPFLPIGPDDWQDWIDTANDIGDLLYDLWSNGLL